MRLYHWKPGLCSGLLPTELPLVSFLSAPQSAVWAAGLSWTLCGEEAVQRGCCLGGFCLPVGALHHPELREAWARAWSLIPSRAGSCDSPSREGKAAIWEWIQTCSHPVCCRGHQAVCFLFPLGCYHHASLGSHHRPRTTVDRWVDRWAGRWKRCVWGSIGGVGVGEKDGCSWALLAGPEWVSWWAKKHSEILLQRNCLNAMNYQIDG